MDESDDATSEMCQPLVPRLKADPVACKRDNVAGVVEFDDPRKLEPFASGGLG
jgi:hypothetical protein